MLSKYAQRAEIVLARGSVAFPGFTDKQLLMYEVLLKFIILTAFQAYKHRNDLILGNALRATPGY